MAGKFEDLKAWQEARKLNVRVYALTAGPAFRGERALVNQLRRATMSIMANLAEGYGRRGYGEISHFFNIAIGSASETQSHLYMALDAGLCASADFGAVYDQAEFVKALTRGFIRNLQRVHATT
jgi:four helix bundle protein